jgi:hypothetical protein
MGSFDVEDSKADIPGGYSRADCVRARPRDGGQIGASENDYPRVQPCAWHLRLQFAVSDRNAAAVKAV